MEAAQAGIIRRVVSDDHTRIRRRHAANIPIGGIAPVHVMVGGIDVVITARRKNKDWMIIHGKTDNQIGVERGRFTIHNVNLHAVTAVGQVGTGRQRSVNLPGHVDGVVSHRQHDRGGTPTGAIPIKRGTAAEAIQMDLNQGNAGFWIIGRTGEPRQILVGQDGTVENVVQRAQRRRGVERGAGQD